MPVDNLEINGNIRIEDIVAPDMEILNSPRIPVASVVMTRQLKQEEAAAGKNNYSKSCEIGCLIEAAYFFAPVFA